MIWLSMRTTSSIEGAFGGIDVIFGKQLINSWMGGFRGGRGTAGTLGVSLAGLFSRSRSLSRSLSLSSSLFDPLPPPLPPFPPPLPPDNVPARAKKNGVKSVTLAHKLLVKTSSASLPSILRIRKLHFRMSLSGRNRPAASLLSSSMSISRLVQGHRSMNRFLQGIL
jgi:hypothetical protein